MNVVVTVRTRNEEHRIGQFCESYKDADLILVADGGSEDNTIAIAQRYPNVWVKSFTERVQLDNGYWRNNDSAHANFLFEWAYGLKPKWVIYDDCDCRPTWALRDCYLKLFAEQSVSYADVIMAVRIYLWGQDQHFPQMAQPGGEGIWEASLWAWRGDLDLWTVNVPPAYTFRIGNKPVADFRKDANTIELLPPYSLLHYSWDDPERVNRKVHEYRASGLIPNMAHPLDFAGRLEPLPDWAHE